MSAARTTARKVRACAYLQRGIHRSAGIPKGRKAKNARGREARNQPHIKKSETNHNPTLVKRAPTPYHEYHMPYHEYLPQAHGKTGHVDTILSLKFGFRQKNVLNYTYIVS